MIGPIADFNVVLVECLGCSLRRYQEYVAGDIIRVVEAGHRFIVVSMPTGSGKTFLELFTAFDALGRGCPRALVVEPTRFLCDQMYSRLWRRVFGDCVGVEYEGRCSSFQDPGRRVVVSTPITALKCVSCVRSFGFRAVILDEVHHAFTGKHYRELLLELDPNLVVGFTALLPSRRRLSLDPRVEEALGELLLLSYGFKELSIVDPSFEPPKAVADLFDAAMSPLEDEAYDALFRGSVPGDPRTLKFLEVTLARYGKRAFCESLARALGRGRLAPDLRLTRLCSTEEPSHKARVLVEVLTAYDVKENPGLKPVIVFTSRKATAYEFKEVIVSHVGLPKERVAVLTSDMSRDERLALVEEAREGRVDVIVSTLVGEEGVDIPEAGLLVMSDTPKSPLRFYQRLGRLIRLASPRRLKYLVVSLTPKTIEYGDLEEALWNLYAEGVDVSYIVVNIPGKTPEARVLDTVRALTSIYNDMTVPYTLITQGREQSNPLNYLANTIKNNPKLKQLLEKWRGKTISSDEELTSLLYRVLTFHMLRYGEEIKELFKHLDRVVNKSRFARHLDQAIERRHVFYIYGVSETSETLAMELRRLYEHCAKTSTRYASNPFFRLDRKSILRLYMRVFPYTSIHHVKERLRRQAENTMKNLKTTWKPLTRTLSIYVTNSESSYNNHNKSVSPKIIITVELDNAWIRLEAQVNYYNITKNMLSEVAELIEVNLAAIGCKAVENFLQHLHECLN